MNDFLVNLVRRGAGLPASRVQAPPPSPFGPGFGTDANALAQEDAPQAAPSEYASQAPRDTRARDEGPDAVAGGPFPAGGRRAAPEPEAAQAQAASVPDRTATGAPAASPEAGPAGIVTPAAGMPAPGARTAPSLPPGVPEAFQAETVRTKVVRTTVVRTTAEGHAGAIGRPARAPRAVMAEAPHHSPSSAAPAGETIDARAPASAAPAPVPPAGEAGTPREPALPVATLRPALPESGRLPGLPRPGPSAQLPVHVRIGKVEVRAAPAPALPPSAAPAPKAPLGFGAYYRVRTYRG